MEKVIFKLARADVVTSNHQQRLYLVKSNILSKVHLLLTHRQFGKYMSCLELQMQCNFTTLYVDPT